MNGNREEILFDKFEIIDCLKKDAQTGVYLADHVYLGKKIILKILDTSELSDTTVLERFKREAKLLAGMDHPNLIKVLDFGTHGEFFYISFEYFESRNLREIIKQGGLSEEDKIKLIVQLLTALNAAHQNGIIHRDIKPENILVNKDLHLKIADFGLALVVNETALTHGASIVGTPGYMSPEQIRGEKTYQTDLFSAGLVALELFTGANPFIGSSVTETINNILGFDEAKVDELLAGVPGEIRHVIHGMLRKDLSARFKSAGDCLALLPNVSGMSTQPVSVNEPSGIQNPKRRPYLKAAAAVIFPVLIILGFWIFKSNHPEVPPSSTDKMQNSSVKQDAGAPVKTVFKENVPAGQTGKIKPNPEKNSPLSQLKTKSRISDDVSLSGMLQVDCYPWADVYVDGRKVDRTPIQQPIKLSAGMHKLELVHPDYPALDRNIKIKGGYVDSVKINLNDLVGYLNCNVYPWGKIFIAGKYIGTTPLNKPLVMLPGNYQLIIKNTGYKDVEKMITIKAKQTLDINVNFDTLAHK